MAIGTLLLLASSTLPTADTSAVSTMQLDCAMTTTGIGSSQEAPSLFRFAVEAGRPAQLRTVSVDYRTEAADFTLGERLRIDGDNTEFVAVDHSVNGAIVFKKGAASSYAVQWSACERDRDQAGHFIFSHCGMYTSGSGECTLIDLKPAAKAGA